MRLLSARARGPSRARHPLLGAFLAGSAPIEQRPRRETARAARLRGGTPADTAVSFETQRSRCSGPSHGKGGCPAAVDRACFLLRALLVLKLLPQRLDGPRGTAAAEEVVIAGQDRSVEQERQGNGGQSCGSRGTRPSRASSREAAYISRLTISIACVLRSGGAHGLLQMRAVHPM